MAFDCSPLPAFCATLWATWWDASSLGLLQLWYSKLTHSNCSCSHNSPLWGPEGTLLPAWELSSTHLFPVSPDSEILWKWSQEQKVPCLKLLKRQESAVRVCIYCLVSWKRFFSFRFLIILFVLSSLHYGKDTLGLCPQWICILVVGRLTFMTNLTNNVIQYNPVLNCKVQKTALLRTGDCKGNF